jgi:hypothetical protein
MAFFAEDVHLLARLDPVLYTMISSSFYCLWVI